MLKPGLPLELEVVSGVVDELVEYRALPLVHGTFDTTRYLLGRTDYHSHGDTFESPIMLAGK